MGEESYESSDTVTTTKAVQGLLASVEAAMQSETERDADGEVESLESIVLEEDREKDRCWWRCKGCACFLFSEPHLEDCPHARVVVPLPQGPDGAPVEETWEADETCVAKQVEDPEEKQARIDAETAAEWD